MFNRYACKEFELLKQRAPTLLHAVHSQCYLVTPKRTKRCLRSYEVYLWTTVTLRSWNQTPRALEQRREK